LSDCKVQVVKKVYDWLLDSKHRTHLLYGSAGSSKSWQVALFLIVEKFLSERDVRILVVRKTLPSLRKSAYQLVQDRLKSMGITYQHNKTEMSIRFNSNQMLFVSLDDVEKLKSIEGINYIWIEEATEISVDDYRQLNLRCRGKNPNGDNALYLTFNPSDWNSFLKPMTEAPAADVGVLHTTYKDNKFLDDKYVQQLESLAEQDEAYHRIYALGEWAQLSGLIYSGWQQAETWPDSFDDTGYGLDFGFNNPTALVQVNLLDGDYYLREIIYEPGLTTKDLIDRLPLLGLDENTEIIADSAEPDRIEEIYRANFNIHAADKGQGSVNFGIDAVRAATIYFHPDSVNLYREYAGYKWREDKDGNVLDEPVKFNDHLMDAIRYRIAKGTFMPGMVTDEDGKIKYDDEPALESDLVTVGDGDDDLEDWVEMEE